MEILVAILLVALIAVVAFAVMQRRARPRAVRRPVAAPVGHRREIPRSDPMAAAVVDHAEAIEPRDVIVAEQRLQARARSVAAGLNAEAAREEAQPPVAPAAGAPVNGHRYPPADPRHVDPGYADDVHPDDRRR